MTPTAPPPGASAGPGDEPPRVAVVAVAYSPGEHLDLLLDSLATAVSEPCVVVVADNGSPDGSVERAAARPDVRVVDTGGNLGYGRAANAGVAVLDPGVQWVLVVNPDVVLGPGCLDRLLAAGAARPAVGSVGPLLTTPEGIVYPSARQLPSIGAGVGHALLGWCWPDNPWTRRYRQDHAAPTERPADWLSGACLLLRRAAFDQVGGFDPGFFMYFEDVDLGDRLGRAGWVNWYCPAATAEHRGGHATQQHSAEMARAHHASAYRYLARRYAAPWQAPLRLALRAGLAARAFAASRSASVGRGAALPERRATTGDPAPGDHPGAAPHPASATRVATTTTEPGDPGCGAR